MSFYKYPRMGSLTFFLFVCCTPIALTCEDELYVIRSTPSGLVLQATSPTTVAMEKYTYGAATQLWRFKRASRAGLFHIINSSTGTALDVDKNEDRTDAVLRFLNGSPQQQWHFHSTGLIVNADRKLNLDIVKENYVPGTPLQIWKDNGHGAQIFELQKKV